ncbi:MAG: CARDB domain-containing protein, partial [Candidatus Omnitrophota bacterium]
FQSIALMFGDNDLDIALDPNLLAGRTSWSGSYHHIYRNPGTYTMRLVAFDQNLKTAETTKTITVQPLSALNDTTPPTGSVVISNGAATTGEKGVMLRITGQDNAGGAGIYRLRVSNDGTNWGAWNSINFADDIPQINVTKDYAWQLSDGSGNKTVYVQLKDASENISAALTDSIELVAQSLQVAGNLSAPVVIDTFYTNPPMPRGSIAISGRTGNTVSANFTATNDWAIGINQMAISFNGQQWTPWMQYETNKQISLEGNLSATKLYVVFADRAGGQSPVYSADIPAASPAQVVAVETQDQAPAASQASTQAVTQAATDQQGQVREGRAGQNSREEKERDLLPRQGDGRAILAQAQPREERVNEEKVFPDIEIENIKVAQELSLGARAEITVSVKNNTKIETPLFEVRFETEDGFKASQKISLAPGRKERVVFEWEPKQEGQPNITVTAEYREDPNPANNSLSQRVKVLGAAKPDVAVNSIRLPREISLEKMIDIEVVLKNESQADVRECLVMMESEDGFQDKTNVSLGPRAQEKILFSWTPRREGRQRLTITAEVEGDVNSSNNKLTESVEVVSERKGEAFGLIKERDEEMLKREAEER